MGTRLRPAVAGLRRGTASALPLPRELAGPLLIRSASPFPGDAAEAFGRLMPGRKTKAGACGHLKEAAYVGPLRASPPAQGVPMRKPTRTFNHTAQVRVPRKMP